MHLSIRDQQICFLMLFTIDLLSSSSILNFWFYFTNMSGLKKNTQWESLSHTRTHTHTDTKTQHSSLLIAFCSLHTTQLHGQIESALIFLHFFFLPNLLFFCNSKLYSGSHSGGQLTPTIFRLQPPVSEPTWKQSVLKAGWQVSVKERRWIGHSRDWLHRPIGQVNVTRHPPLPPCCNG